MATREERNRFNAAAQRLGAAAARGDVEAVRKMLAAEPVLIEHTRPFTDACKHGQAATLEVLLEAGGADNPAFPAGPTERGWRGLHAVVRTPGNVRWGESHNRAVELLLRCGADVDDGAERGFMTPLSGAAQQGNREAVELLRSHGARVGLHEAAILGEVERVRELLDEEPSLARRAWDGFAANVSHPVTALHFAAVSRMGMEDETTAARLAETAELLITHGAPAAEAVLDGVQVPGPIRAAGQGRNVAVLRVLLAHGAEPQEALASALGSTALDVLAVLSDHPVDPGAPGDPKLDNRLLHEMVRAGKLRSAEWLLARGADAGLADRNGWTPLHYAARRGVPGGFVRALLGAGADPAARDVEGRTALDVARLAKRADVVAVLEEATD